jgi:hypothetical protein
MKRTVMNDISSLIVTPASYYLAPFMPYTYLACIELCAQECPALQESSLLLNPEGKWI